MPVATTNFGFNKPLVNSATDQDLWGGQLNTDLDNVDSLGLTMLNWTPSSQSSTITVTAPTSGSVTTGSAKKLFLCNATGGAFAANLPSAATASGMVVAFKKTDSSNNAITVTANGGDLIDGAATFVIGSQYSYVIISCDGTGWDILSQTAPSVATASTSVAGILKLATAAIALTGSDASTALTASSVSSNSSIVQNGYYKFPGGLILQWGQATGTLTGTASFPTAFSSACYSISLTGNIVNGNPPWITSLSASQFSWQQGNSSTTTIYFIAIGK